MSAFGGKADMTFCGEANIAAFNDDPEVRISSPTMLQAKRKPAARRTPDAVMG
jgi:hypothetical protein